MKRTAWILVVLVSGCRETGHISKLFGGDRNVERVESPERVEAFRLGPPKTQAEASLNYNQGPVLAGPIPVDKKIAAELSAALLEEKTYDLWDEGKGHRHSPPLMLKFFRESRSIDVVFCFECHMLFTFQEGKVISGANYDYSHNMLLKMFMKIFPLDLDLPKLLLRESNP